MTVKPAFTAYCHMYNIEKDYHQIELPSNKTQYYLSQIPTVNIVIERVYFQFPTLELICFYFNKC